MKRVLLLFFVVLTAKVVLAEDPVHFADQNLKAVVEQALGIADPNATDMLGLTSLDARSKNVSDLTGLEYALNLALLDVHRNQIEEISVLSGLTSLTYLNLHINQISDISAISGLTNLTFLDAHNNPISDMSAVAGLTNLTSLHVGDTTVSDISAISELTNLTYLHLGNDRISDISAISGLTNLTELFLYGNQISDISDLAGLTNLRGLYLYGNQITEISVLSGLTNLRVLRLDDNQISDISALCELTSLMELRLENNPLNDSAYCVCLLLIQQNNPAAEISYDPPPPTVDCNSLSVALDIKPQSCPNPLNVKSRGVFPLAVLGTEDFDVSLIDTASIELAGVSAIRSSLEDVATVIVDGNECQCTEGGPDGYVDLNLKFRTQEIVGELVDTPGDLADGQVLALTLAGRLLDDTPIEGTDCVVLVGNVPRSLAAMKSDITRDGIVNIRDFAVLCEYWLELAGTKY
jgi:hypothetical protein